MTEPILVAESATAQISLPSLAARHGVGAGATVGSGRKRH
jgi:hypothetical protein